MKTTSRGRPATLAEVAHLRLSGCPFDPSLLEFLDEFYVSGDAPRQMAIVEKPPLVSKVHDAYLAAVAEHLGLSYGLTIPLWTEEPNRFLETPFFAGGAEVLKALLLVESPLAFRRRQIFVSHDALHRPRMEALAQSCIF